MVHYVFENITKKQRTGAAHVLSFQKRLERRDDAQEVTSNEFLKFSLAFIIIFKLNKKWLFSEL